MLAVSNWVLADLTKSNHVKQGLTSSNRDYLGLIKLNCRYTGQTRANLVQTIPIRSNWPPSKIGTNTYKSVQHILEKSLDTWSLVMLISNFFEIWLQKDFLISSTINQVRYTGQTRANLVQTISTRSNWAHPKLSTNMYKSVQHREILGHIIPSNPDQQKVWNLIAEGFCHI